MVTASGVPPPASNAKCPPGSPTAAKAASGPRLPARKSLEEFDYDHARGLKRDTIAHLGTLTYVVAKDNIVFLGPPAQAKPACDRVSFIRACHRAARSTAAEWVTILA